MRGDTLARAGKAKALLGRRLDVHAVHAHIAGRGIDTFIQRFESQRHPHLP